jgi:Skp family chaperone for outer membrane proteins
VGREQGLTLIFNKFQSGLVYADQSVDITDDVIRRFNLSQ